MSTPKTPDVLTTSCASCGATEPLDSTLQRMIDDDATRGLISDLVTRHFVLGGVVMRYVRLHAPAKHRMSSERVRDLLAELVPAVIAGRLEHKGRSLDLDRDAWQAGFGAVFAAVDKGVLKLPLSGNGYLYGVLANMHAQHVERTAAAAEQQRDDARRQGAGRPATYTVHGQALPAAEALQVAFGGKDPALAKIDADRKAGAPMPADVRARIDSLRGRKEA